MTKQEKTFAIDLMRALDLSIDNNVQSIEQYETDLNGETKKQVLQAVREMISQGYVKVLTNKA